MAGKIVEMSKIKQVILLSKEGYSNRRISRELDIDKSTVNTYIRFIKDNGLDADFLLEKDEPELERIFHKGNPAYADDARMAVFLSELPIYREELSTPHVTRYLVWEEYRRRHPDGYGKSQFFFHLKQNLVAEKSSTNAVFTGMYIPGQKLFVDFAGKKLHYVDTDTGEIIPVEVFVASMPYSDYGFVICVPSQCKEDFIHAIRRCMEYLGGVPAIVVPDNLKSAVKKAHRYEPELNKALEDMGNHYHFAVIPCQPHEPTQKALVENHVRLAYHHIYAKVRHRTFYSLQELNDEVLRLVDEHNRTRMQKRPYSREENFFANEKPVLKPLPETEYEIKETAILTVQPNCCIELRRNGTTHFYSVPYIHVGKKATVIFTRSIVKIYVDGKCEATHLRSHVWGYTKVSEHFASNNQIQMSKSSAYYIDRAAHISEDFRRYVEKLFDKSRTSQPEEVYYKTCDMLLGLYRRSEPDRFNATCRLCLNGGIFTGKRFESVLKNRLLVPSDVPVLDAPVPTEHGNMRGSAYYK